MNTRRCAIVSLLSCSLAAASTGCGTDSAGQKAAADTSKKPQAVAQPAPIEAPPIAPPIAPPPGVALSSVASAASQPTSTAPGDEPAPGMVREVAKAGVTGKGGYSEEGILAPITMPLNTYWSAKEKASYEIAIPRAMQLFEFEKERKPNSHEEFMREVIQKHHIPLPELPFGVRYVYDPKRGQLMVERPIGTP